MPPLLQHGVRPYQGGVYEETVRGMIYANISSYAPVILATNKVALAHMPMKVLALILCTLARDARVPVCVHLDHGTDFNTVAKAVLCGYSSVMYDGSQLPFQENVSTTSEIVKFAHACGIPVEAEIGSVGYDDPTVSAVTAFTDPEEAKQFSEQTGIDALAVAVGTIHRMQEQSAVIQYDRLDAIQRLTDTPIVIHGSTGITDDDLTRLITYNVVKVNVGTALRMAFGLALREEIRHNPQQFDRVALFKVPMQKVKEAAKNKLELLRTSNCI